MNSNFPCCRVCLFKTETNCTLFKHCAFSKLTYADMLCYVTDIKVTINDGLSDKLCKACCRDLEKAYSFTVLAKNSDKKLHESGSVKKKLSFNSITDIKKELNDLSVKKEKRKLVFNSISDIKGKLYNFNVKKGKSPEVEVVNKIPCNPGNTSLIANTTIKKIKTQNKSIEISDDDDVGGGNVSDDNFFKDDTDFLNNDLDFFLSDEEKVRRKQKPKPANSKRPKTIEKVLKIGNACIISNPDLKIKKIQNKMGAVTVTRTLKPKKIATVVNGKPKVFKSNEKPLIALKITDASRVTTKRIMSTSEWPSMNEKTVCPICGILTYSLEHHMITHKEKEFKCQMCSKEYHQQSQLDQHMRHHTGEKSFICDECGQGYLYKKNLERHTIVVHQNKKISCTLCTKQFANKGTLRNHMDTHEGIKRHQCTVCGSAFRRHHHLKAHMVTHTGERIFYCEVCYTDFPYKVNLNKHVLRDHNINIKGRQITKFTRDLMRQEIEKMELAFNNGMPNNIVNEQVDQ